MGHFQWLPTTRQNDKKGWRIQNTQLQSSLGSDWLLPLEHSHTHTGDDTAGQDIVGGVLMTS